MHKKICNLFMVVFWVLVILMTIILVVQYGVIENKEFYLKQYKATKSAVKLELSQEDQIRITEHMIGYFVGRQNSLQLSVSMLGEQRDFFTERELLHMIDVRELVCCMILSKNIITIILGIQLVILVIKRSVFTLGRLASSFLKTNTFLLGAVFISLVACIINFDYVFTLFHQTFFDNELWVLNPFYDKLVVLLPVDFFMAAALKIVALVGAILLPSAVFAFVILLRQRRS